MKVTLCLFSLITLLVSSVSATFVQVPRHVRHLPRSSRLPLRTARLKRDFPALSYEDGQISDGLAGIAASEAAAICVSPFEGVDLASVARVDLDNLKAFREAAEDAELDFFNPAIEAASGAEADALQVGKIKNKVLKLTCEVQALQIAQALNGDDNAAKIGEEQTKLAKNIALDKASSGKDSVGIAGDTAATPTSTSKNTADVVEPVPSTTSSPKSLFPPLAYENGQISDGAAGTAKEEAAAVCVAPFESIDLASVSPDDLENLKAFRGAAEDTETSLFNPAIESAKDEGDDTAAAALQVGKIKNKVLKLTCIIQALEIAQAQGSDNSAKITIEQAKLTKNIKTDQQASGQTSQSVV